MGLLRAHVEVGESVRVPIVYSSKTAPHFGHFSALSSTSAPQFVHVRAAALLAFKLFVGSTDSTLGFGFSFGICGSPPRLPGRGGGCRTVCRHMNRTMEYNRKGRRIEEMVQ